MHEPRISVIVPVYNPGPFLTPCLESIQAQTFLNFEVLLVDNGSTDGSSALCDQWAQKDTRFRVVHQQNQTALAGRASGFAQSRGDYIAFVDSDDLLHPRMLEFLLDACQGDNLPCACCRFVSFLDKPPQSRDGARPAAQRMEAPRHLDSLLHHSGVNYSLCNKLYHRSLLDSSAFASPVIHNEDLYLNWQVLQEAPGLVFLDFVGYYYRQHSRSTSHQPPDDGFFEDQLLVARLIRNTSQNTCLEDSGWAFYYEKLLYLNSMILRRRDAARYAPRQTNLAAALKAELRQALHCPELSLSMKLTALLSCWGGGFYRLLCRLLLRDRR